MEDRCTLVEIVCMYMYFEGGRGRDRHKVVHV